MVEEGVFVTAFSCGTRMNFRWNLKLHLIAPCLDEEQNQTKLLQEGSPPSHADFLSCPLVCVFLESSGIQMAQPIRRPRDNGTDFEAD